MKRPLFNRQYRLYSPADVEDEPVRRCLEATATMGYADLMRWLYAQQMQDEAVHVLPLNVHTAEAVRRSLVGGGIRMLLVMRPLHTIEHLNDFLYAANSCLPQGGWMWVHSMTAGLKRKLLEERYPKPIGTVATWMHYLLHRVMPKLKLTRPVYYRLTKGINLTYSRVEIVGRLYRAGFAVVDEGFRDGEYLLTLRKVKEPTQDTPPNGSPIVSLRRIGKDGREITVYKLRTMHTYSEYMQPYIYQQHQLERGGKFKRDYRVSTYGAVLRRVWLDELPMVWNIIRGDLKLVGIRPLSQQYFSLYSKEMQTLRVKVKPGLLPPFYYDEQTPETLEEVQESERRYIEAYLERPFATDWRYFWGIVKNIVFRRKRSR